MWEEQGCFSLIISTAICTFSSWTWSWEQCDDSWHNTKSMQKDDVTFLRPHCASDDVGQTTFNGSSVNGVFHRRNELYKWGKQCIDLVSPQRHAWCWKWTQRICVNIEKRAPPAFTPAQSLLLMACLFSSLNFAVKKVFRHLSATWRALCWNHTEVLMVEHPLNLEGLHFFCFVCSIFNDSGCPV